MTKRWIPPIANESVRLRLLQEADLPMTLRWRNQDHIRRWFFKSDILTAEHHRAWFEKYRENDNDFVFVIEELPTGCPVGQVALYHIDWQSRCAEFGRLMIGETHAAGKGLAHAAADLLLRTGLRNLRLREAHLEVFADNAKAIAIYRACGFQVVGKRDNVVMMAKASEET